MKALSALILLVQTMPPCEQRDGPNIRPEANVGISAAIVEQIQNLDLSNRVDIKNEEFQLLSRARNLRILRLEGTRVTDQGISYLTCLGGLEQLSISATPISDRSLSHISKLKNLRWLDLSGTAIGDEGLSRLNKNAALRWLNVEGTQITDTGMSHVSHLVNLETLRLPGSISGKGLSQLKGLSRLESLSFGQSPIGDDGVISLVALPGLRQINLRDANLTRKAIAVLSQLKNLEDLNLAENKMAGADFDKLPRVMKLNLFSTDVEDSDVRRLTAVKSLRELNLANTRITDASLGELVSMKTLTSLNLSGTGITDDGLKNCGTITVSFLFLTATSVTRQGVEAARSKFPKTTFVWFD